MNNHQLAFGAEPSKIDLGAIHAHQVMDMATMPPSEFEIKYDHPHYNQKGIGVCTAINLCDMAQKIWGIPFSVSFTYWGGKSYDGGLYEGSSNLSMLKWGKNVGFLPLSLDPNGNDMTGNYQDYLARRHSYTPEQMASAGQYKLSGYALAPLDPVGFMTALSNSKYGLLTRTATGDNWYRPSWRKSDLELLRVPSPITGGHSVKVVYAKGLDPKQLRRNRNTWGDKDNPTIAPGLEIWSDDGDIMYEYDTQAPYVTEAYVVYAGEPIVFKHKFTSVISFGQSSPEVTALQRVLVQLGYLKMPVGVPFGYYGNLTKQAVLAFQIASNIVPNNGGQSVGQRTIGALNLAQGL